MNIRSVPEMGSIAFLAPLLAPFTSAQKGSVTVVERNTALSASVVGVLALGIVAIAILKKKKVI